MTETAASGSEPFLVHSLPDRVRVHLPNWDGENQRPLEAELRRHQGIESVRANPLTGNVVVSFTPGATTAGAVLQSILAFTQRKPDRTDEPPPGETVARRAVTAAPHAIAERPQNGARRARITVRGLDRSPRVARRVVERLEALPGVCARANPLTGRVLVEWTDHQLELEDLISEVADVELPDVSGEDRPDHPLDPAPLMQSAARAAGASLGLGWLAVQRFAGASEPLISGRGPAYVSTALGIAQSFPAVRNGLRSVAGPNLSQLLLSLPDIVISALSGSPLALVLSLTTSVRLLTEVMARRAAWRRYEDRLGDAADAYVGAVIRLDAGARSPLAGTVIEGTGTALGEDGLPMALAPGAAVPAGARLQGGPFVVELADGKAFPPTDRPAQAPGLYERYQQGVSWASLAYAILLGVVSRSPARVFEGLLLVNPRAALIGQQAANLGASARVLRAGVTVVGSRQERKVRRPDVLLLDGPRLLTGGLEVSTVVPMPEFGEEPAEILRLAAGVAAAAASPWGAAFPQGDVAPAEDGAFEGALATATIEGIRYVLGPVADGDPLAAATLGQRGDLVLALRSERDAAPLGLLALRPRLAPGAAEMVESCRRFGVEIVLQSDAATPAAWAVARRAGVPLEARFGLLAVIRDRQKQGLHVAVVSDSADAAEAFAACDLAIGLSSGRSGQFPARADLLAPELGAVAAIIEAGARREATVRDSVGLSAVANIAGAVWGLRGGAGLARASQGVYLAAIAAQAVGWARLRGGERSRSFASRLADPRPERWGRQDASTVLRAMAATEQGLSTAEAEARRRPPPPQARRRAVFAAIADQLNSPLIGILAAGAGLSLFLGSPLDFALIGATILANVAVGAWQERQAGVAAEALARLGTATAGVLRDGVLVVIPAVQIVPGDVLVLASGDRVAADARLLEARGLEVDEAALTGESLPVAKMPTGGTETSRVILEGSDITTGTGRAVVVAVGAQTRMGATAAALTLDETEQSPLGQRLGRLLRQFLPLAGVGGGLVVGSGLLRGQAFLPQLAVGATIALAAVPEGLPLLAGMGEAAVARRLAGRRALVRRLSAVEALGRVDVACTDKTGTLTEGTLALALVASGDDEAVLPGVPDDSLRAVLRAAAYASPHPDAPDFAAHPTDVAVVQGALAAGLEGELDEARAAEVPFDPARSFHATLCGEWLTAKGAPESLLARCAFVRRAGSDVPLDDAGREALLAQARELGGRGLRILMVAERRQAAASVTDPQGLTALGFVGIRDPLRAGVRASIRRCREAGIQILMLTGDHPATARAIAEEAGLLDGGREVLTSAELAELQNGDLAQRLEQAAVIARATPLDKLRIIESLQGRGHTVAMTGDGVNDAPALRLADVGVAMGRGGTEVARQAADLVLADDDFATLVEALVEGRGFWRNMRRALGLLLGGNLGELGLVVGASLLGLASPLTTRQILAVNLITDALPALSVALQRPEHRHLASLAREGASALDTPLRKDVLRRGAATTFPALAAFAITLGTGGLAQARTVAFASIVATQLAQTLKAGWVEGGLTPPVFGAVAASSAFLVAAITVPALRTVLTLTLPTPFSWALIGTGAVIAAIAGGASFQSSDGLAPSLTWRPPAVRRPRALLPVPALAS